MYEAPEYDNELNQLVDMVEAKKYCKRHKVFVKPDEKCQECKRNVAPWMSEEERRAKMGNFVWTVFAVLTGAAFMLWRFGFFTE